MSWPAPVNPVGPSKWCEHNRIRSHCVDCLIETLEAKLAECTDRIKQLEMALAKKKESA